MLSKKEEIKLVHSFHDAIQSKDLELVKKIMAEHPDLSIDTDMLTVPPILYAAQKEDWPMVIYFYELGANLDVKTVPYNWFLAHECILTAPLNIAKSILTYSNINAQTADGETPLMIAIKKNKDELANFILDSERCSLSLIDVNKDNALHYAAKYNKHDIFLKIVKLSKLNILNQQNNKGLFPEELLTDEIFKSELPKRLVDNNKSIALEEKVLMPSVKKETIKEVSKVTGLSSITKKKLN